MGRGVDVSAGDAGGGHEDGHHGLRANALGLFESAVMGVAGVAPAYSIAATTAKGCIRLFADPRP